MVRNEKFLFLLGWQLAVLGWTSPIPPHPARIIEPTTTFPLAVSIQKEWSSLHVRSGLLALPGRTSMQKTQCFAILSCLLSQLSRGQEAAHYTSRLEQSFSQMKTDT